MTNRNGLRRIKKMRRGLLFLIAAVFSLVVFFGTYFAYFLLHQAKAVGSSIPLWLGVGLFFIVMSALNYLVFVSPDKDIRFAKAIGFALLESAIFIFLLLFLLLNSFGS